MAANCKTCNAAIVWARTEQGRAIPLDAKVVANGNIIIDGGIAKYVKPDPTIPRFVTHFSTCPQRVQHRRPK